MVLKTFRPTTSSQRQLVIVDRTGLSKEKPIKALTVGLTKTGGRNNSGRITVRHIGGGHKRKYRLVDFKRNTDGVKATVERIEYDPNRTGYIALIKYDGGELSYVIASQNMKTGDIIESGDAASIKEGNTLALKNIPLGTMVHNVELKPGAGGKLARSAGCYANLIGKDSGYVLLRLRSGEVRYIPLECRATIGVVSNSDHQNINDGKAGRTRHRGTRPTVRGVAMNPIDHPHGGGEGKTSGGRHPVSPWGQCAKGKRTRSNKRTDKYILRRRYKK